MSQDLTIDKKKYVKASEAARLVGYSSDHVSRLARVGEIDAEKRGRSWYVDPESLKLFSLKVESEKRARGEEIRAERLHERAVATRKLNDAAILDEIDRSRQHAIFQTAVLSIALFLLFNLAWFSFESRLHVANLADGVHTIFSDVTDHVSFSVPPFISQFASFAFIERSRESIEVQQEIMIDDVIRPSDDEAFEGIIIFDDEDDIQAVEAVRESFSDEVQVEFDGEDTGVVTPIFQERDGESYRFLLVPVDERDE